MSFSSKAIESPIKKYIEWKGSDGYFHYWDSEITDESGEAVGGEVRLPEKFQVIPLDILKYVGGHNNNENKPIRSNEIRHIGSILNIRTSNGTVIANGTWKEVANQAKAQGAKFGNSVYCLLIIKGQEPELVCMKIIGSSMKGVLLAKEAKTAYFKIQGNGHVLTCGKNETLMTHGKTQYYVPTFVEKKFPPIDKMTEAQKSLYDMAFEMDLELQIYLDDKLNKDKEEVSNPVATASPANIPTAPAMDLSNAPQPSSDNDIDDLPF